MRKLNNKGVTLIELLVSFSVASIIIISMFNVVLSYQREASMETIKSEIVSYKNTITKTIQNDIIKGNLRSVNLVVNNQSNKTTYTMRLRFNKSVNFSGRGGDVFSKDLKVVASNTESNSNYIEYPDINTNGTLQIVRYSLIDLAKGCFGKTNPANSGDTGACQSYQNVLKFSSINTNINAATSGDLGLNSNNNEQSSAEDGFFNNARYFKLDIALSHPDLGGDYHIYIVAPLNYPYCKPTD